MGGSEFGYRGSVNQYLPTRRVNFREMESTYNIRLETFNDGPFLIRSAGTFEIDATGDVNIGTDADLFIESNAYVYQWPTDTPATGEQLEVASVVGNAVTLQWASAAGGGYTRTVVNSATYTVLSSDEIIAVTYTATGAVTITLPAISVVGAIQYTIVDEGGNAQANPITIDTTGADTIVGTTDTQIRADYNAIRVYNDGTSAWFIF